MLRNGAFILAILLAFGSSGLSANAFARGRSGVGGEAGNFSGNRSGAGGDTVRDGRGGCDDRTSGLRGGFCGYGGRDMWGHWGAYYGPMVPKI